MDYSTLVPTSSFIGRYLTYMQIQETAQAFDFWTAMWCLSCACGRRTLVDRPRSPVYLNMFCILIGDSGVARKSTAVRTAGGLVRSLLTTEQTIGYIDSKMTAEALDLLLHDATLNRGSAQMAVCISELATFLGTERYVANMPILLTDLYDCPQHRHGGGTITRGEVVQRNVWLSFLAASTPIWLLKSVNPNVIEGGFTSRCYFIVANQPKRRIAWPSATEAMTSDVLLTDLCVVQTESRAHPTITLDGDAMDEFVSWYDQREHALDSFKQSFEAREDAHVLRIAALLAVNEHQWSISRQHMLTAITLVTELKQSSGNIFEGSEYRTKFASALDSMRSTLISAGMDAVPRHKLFMKCQHALDNVEFMALIEVLHEIGAIQRFEFRTGERGRPTDYIRGTELLLARGLGDMVMEKFS